MTILNTASLPHLPPTIVVPAYDRGRVTPGIAHISVGNFHRAHQAVYMDRVLARPGQSGWGILGIGLMENPHEAAKAQDMAAQDCLYSLTECAPDAPNVVRVIGSITQYMYAPADRAATIARLADPAIRIVSMTVTEGGYYVDENGVFPIDHPVIAEDLKRDVPHTVFGLLTEALRQRRESGAGPFTILSCDNLPQNGHVARTAFLGWARAKDAGLAQWIEANVTFPCTMVDRITPAVHAEDVRRLDAESGLDDRIPVFCEDFIQWVVEDRFCAGRPELEAVGVQFTDNVQPYEEVKLHMLNASHSLLGLSGVLSGYRVVSEIMADLNEVTLVEQYLGYDAEPLLSAPPGMALSEYGRRLLHRFRNRAISDQLLRIASDSTSKLPMFIRSTAMGVIAHHRPVARIAFVVACYAEYLRGHDDRGETYVIVEPHLTEEDRILAASSRLEDALGMSALAGWGLAEHPAFVQAYVALRQSIRAHGTRATLATVISAGK
ncbi:mannitol dehydrogenase [Komagataeibacter rhaeticus]|uniref:mannitol dehydrogenase family protein n=1 Tax=Komagataeibacter rhaeticus TaxID=215221 RepID=UPI000D9E92F6|nr:mannitol dehydrogenase family protein [Komagataeibacter rhaeticus]MBL7238620.1 mannitol dehydrogenase family protein [Komagataeibacter rhaeticus]PYD53651.1 mannitol dehydrogenase [Komagataeibacter rhaeticus]GBQ11098.1 NADPH-dependent L-sorbose reductase [Komagataeibacter rhaeticus DSM 16663]